MWKVSICRGKLQDVLEILTSKSGVIAEFSKYRFSRKVIYFQPNEVYYMNEIDVSAVAIIFQKSLIFVTFVLKF